MKKIDIKKWSDRLLICSKRSNEAEEKEFLHLLDIEVSGDPKLIAIALIKTFSNAPDYGTQEKVVSKLSEIEPETYIEALLEGLPHLIENAEDWVESLLGPEIIYRPQVIKEKLSTMPRQVITAFHKVVSNPGFRDTYPEVEDFL